MEEPSVRTKKMAAQIQRELAEILRREVDDPRIQALGMITISRIDLANDHRDATVLVSFMGMITDGPKLKEAVEVLNHSASFIRTKLGKLLHTKVVPRLRFRYDAGFDHAAAVARAMNEPRSNEEE